MGGVSDTLMLDVIFITRSAITAAVVDLCATLSLDAARATVSPINDHDSARPVNSCGTGRCTVTCMVTLAGEAHRLLV
ncbi:hypothetical protein [Burkholderia sp. BE17]|uniref:hypothetical protein n=1 Tax=Burkholderia sp. BE17 TaxID=2656644 RepID=UPI00128B2C54|nr:hypothetical protein [Burkholderia sp. BE17]MPV70443.1 hypothetical protein [Burkholderia sp. BE17]